MHVDGVSGVSSPWTWLSTRAREQAAERMEDAEHLGGSEVLCLSRADAQASLKAG